MRIRIIATIGPSTSKPQIIERLVKAGAGIGRINMKHASFGEALKTSNILSKSKCKVLIDVESLEDLSVIKGIKFDFLALSFTETAKQIKAARKAFAPKKVFVIAKIESAKGIKNIKQIIREADGVMVARGDLGDHTPITRLPLMQKMIIRECNKQGKMVVTATEMLLSMIDSKTPTRAEVSDVANAVLDGSDALMLSEETAIGKYPVEAVTIMREIIDETVKSRNLF